MENPIYLGDGLYATFEDVHVILTTGHHEPTEARHVIYLEPAVVIKLVEWLAAIPRFRSDQSPGKDEI